MLLKRLFADPAKLIVFWCKLSILQCSALTLIYVPEIVLISSQGGKLQFHFDHLIFIELHNLCKTSRSGNQQYHYLSYSLSIWEKNRACFRFFELRGALSVWLRESRDVVNEVFVEPSHDHPLSRLETIDNDTVALSFRVILLRLGVGLLFICDLRGSSRSALLELIVSDVVTRWEGCIHPTSSNYTLKRVIRGGVISAGFFVLVRLNLIIACLKDKNWGRYETRFRNDDPSIKNLRLQ